MEHLVQFAIGIDDDTIVKNITKYAEKQIKDDLMKKLESNIEHEVFNFTSYRWDNTETKCGLQDWVKNQVADILNKHQNEIIERAAYHLADKMSRTKVIKEAMVEKVSEG